jgi:hypothetical protein
MQKHRQRATFRVLAGVLLGLCGHAPAQGGPEDTVWTKLCNGTDLKDWDVKVMDFILSVRHASGAFTRKLLLGP